MCTSGALGDGTPGWVWRCDAAISRSIQKKHSYFGVFIKKKRAAAKTNIKITPPLSLIPKVLGHV